MKSSLSRRDHRKLSHALSIYITLPRDERKRIMRKYEALLADLRSRPTKHQFPVLT